MKSFLLFSGADYYPEGGFHDFLGDFDTEEEAVKAFKDTADTFAREWAHIVMLERKDIVLQYGGWVFGKPEGEWRAVDEEFCFSFHKKLLNGEEIYCNECARKKRKSETAGRGP